MKIPMPSAPDSFLMKDLVEISGGDDTRGRVVATRDDGAVIYVMWWQRVGHEGKVTMERAADLRKFRGVTA